ncbi:MAG TPA: 30S ribosome-binding factor RbfA [Polyangia bacterium]|jgi:ribosome-binding factor A
MTVAGIRPQRIAGIVQETVTEILMTGGIRDPRVANTDDVIVVTFVRVADDLGVAWIYVSIRGEHVKETLAGLRSATKYLRGEVAKRMRAKRLPELRFELDTEAEREVRVEQAFREIEEERRLRAGEGAPPAGAGGAPPAPDAAAGDHGDEDDEDDEDDDEGE